MSGLICAFFCIGGLVLLFCLVLAVLASREREAAGLFVAGAFLCGLLLVAVFVLSQVLG